MNKMNVENNHLTSIPTEMAQLQMLGNVAIGYNYLDCADVQAMLGASVAVTCPSAYSLLTTPPLH